MPRLTRAVSRSTLADQYFERRLPTNAALIASGAAVVALSTQLTIPLWPVPVTAQTIAVLLVGASLGSARGALSLLVYALLGIIGLPIFSGGDSGLATIGGSTGGFIVGFIGTAALIGWLAERHWDRRFRSALVALAIAALVPFAFGLPWLAWWLGQAGAANDVASVLATGLYPFIVGEVATVVVAALVLWLAWRRVTRPPAAQPIEAE